MIFDFLARPFGLDHYVDVVLLIASSGCVLIESFLELFMCRGCSCCALERVLGCLQESVGFLDLGVVVVCLYWFSPGFP
jgi:predicted transcriptional regulator